MTTTKKNNADFQKLIWIELIGFDNTKPDFGVAELLSRMEIKPTKVALLLCDTELIHAHRTLQKHGIKVFAAFFDYVMFEDSAKRHNIPDFDAWNSQHKELLYTADDGSTARCVCHFKHLSDGRLYEDFFSERHRIQRVDTRPVRGALAVRDGLQGHRRRRRRRPCA